MLTWWQILLINITAVGGVNSACIFIVKKYITYRIKYDFAKKLEALKPMTAEEVLRRENYLNSKRDIFFNALEIMSRYHEAVPWEGPDVPIDRVVSGEVPTEAEVNACFARLAIFSDDPALANKFLSSLGGTNPIEIGQFVDCLRKDLKYGSIPFSPADYARYYRRKKSNTDQRSTEPQ